MRLERVAGMNYIVLRKDTDGAYFAVGPFKIEEASNELLKSPAGSQLVPLFPRVAYRGGSKG